MSHCCLCRVVVCLLIALGGSTVWAQPPSEPAPAKPDPPAAGAAVPAPNGKITNVYQDTDLRQALSDVATQTGTTILADESIQGQISLELKDVPLEDALELMLLPGGFVYEKVRDKVYLVTSADPKLQAFKTIAKTEVVNLSYITSDDLKALLPDIYQPFVKLDQSSWSPSSVSSGTSPGYYSSSSYGSPASPSTVTVSPTSRVATVVVVTAPRSLLSKIVETIRLLDQRPTQVMIEALIIETTKGSGFDFSVDAQGANVGGSNSTGIFTYVDQAEKSLYQALLLVQRSKAKIKASPRVVAQAGRQANVRVAVQQYFQLLSGSVAYSYQSLQAIESAIGLDITPRVALEERQVTCTLTPEVGEVTGKSNNNLPIITKRTASTTVRVKDGQIIAIGGLLQEAVRETRRGIPILSDIPLVGSLFESKSTERQQVEILIFVVPHILDELGNYDGPLLMDRVKDTDRVQPKPVAATGKPTTMPITLPSGAVSVIPR